MKRLLILLVFIGCVNNPNITNNTKTVNSNNLPVGAPGSPAVPIGVKAVSGNFQNTITWTNQTDATSFHVYFNTLGNVNFSNSTKYTANTNSFTHTGLTNGTVYYYVVTALNAAGESTESVQVQAMAGLIDRHNGSIYVSSLNQTWEKCSENYYNAATDSCNPPSIPTHMYCATDTAGICDNGIFLTSGDTWSVCKNMTIAGRSTWRVPTIAELQAVYAVSNANPGLFGMFQDYHWATNAPVFYQVSMWDGTVKSPIWRTQTAYVECVSDGI